MRPLFLCFVFLAGCANSCGDSPARKSQGFQVSLPPEAKAIFENADSLEIFATDPQDLGAPPDAAPPPDRFHGHHVIAHALVTDAADRKAILDALLSGISHHKSAMVACNEPRHGFRIGRGDQTADVQMSFGCLHGTLFAKNARTTLLTSTDDKDDLDDLFAKYNVPSGK